jgi:O-acetyl-ADP-ribose deacetylase (regulator of RNase III)
MEENDVRASVDPMTHFKLIQTSDSKVVHFYTGDLTPLEKSNLDASLIDDNALQITFQQLPSLSFTIRRQDIFDSEAQVIVNAANSHLGGGGGIDGAIHRQGGNDYAQAHRELQTLYNSQYVLGHAAMIGSGLLKKSYHIDNVIVVAGPQGETNSTKENELYSCYYNSLVLAQAQSKTSIAFPSISTGIFGFPKDRAASISLKAILDFINQYPNTTIKTISIHFLPNEPKTNLEIYQSAV